MTSTAGPATRTRQDARSVAAAVSALGESVFAQVEALRAVVEPALARPKPTRADLAPVEPVVDDALVGPDRLPVGAGFVAAPSVLADASYWLEWWVLPGGDRPRERLAAVTDPEADGFRDYTALPWFRVPRDTGARHVTGPYVDYLCTDEYTLTFTAPVVAHGEFSGVVGADVYVREVERRVMPLVRSLPDPAALVNRQGRVVFGSGDDVTGSLLRRVDVEGLWRLAEGGGDGSYDGVLLAPCAGLPLAVVTGPALG